MFEMRCKNKMDKNWVFNGCIFYNFNVGNDDDFIIIFLKNTCDWNRWISSVTMIVIFVDTLVLHIAH